jgi:hypothetical protein
MYVYVYVFDSLMRLSSGRDSQLRHKAVTAEGEAVARASSALHACTAKKESPSMKSSR